MRLIESAWALFGFSASALTAGWWQPAFIWAAVALALLAVLTLAVGRLLDAWNETRHAQWVMRMESLEQRVETLQKAQAFQALR